MSILFLLIGNSKIVCIIRFIPLIVFFVVFPLPHVHGAFRYTFLDISATSPQLRSQRIQTYSLIAL